MIVQACQKSCHHPCAVPSQSSRSQRPAYILRNNLVFSLYEASNGYGRNSLIGTESRGRAINLQLLWLLED
jgi:hypothetical protein